MKMFWVLVIGLALGRSGKAESYVQLDDLMGMDQSQLDSLYADSEAGPLPEGTARGTALLFAGSSWEFPAAKLAHVFWQGKTFDIADDLVINSVVGLPGVLGTLSYGDSVFDGKRSILISYHDKTVFFRGVTDELRQVAPKLYLGRAYDRVDQNQTLWANFALEF